MSCSLSSFKRPILPSQEPNSQASCRPGDLPIVHYMAHPPYNASLMSGCKNCWENSPFMSHASRNDFKYVLTMTIMMTFCSWPNLLDPLPSSAPYRCTNLPNNRDRRVQVEPPPKIHYMAGGAAQPLASV